MRSVISKNYLYSVVYQVISVVAPLITTPYVSRIFGPDNLGIYSYTYSVSHYFVIFALLGLTNYGNRSVASVRDDKIELNKVFSEIYTMQAITSIICIIIYGFYVAFFGQKYYIYYLILLIYVLSALFDINWLFFGLEEFKFTATRSTLIKIISVICILCFIKTKNDLWIYFLIYALSGFVSCLILWPRALRRVSFVKVGLNQVISHLRPNIVLFVPVVAVSIYKYMDKIMLGAYSTTEAGFYENSEKILTIALGTITAFGTVMMPKVSNLVANRGKNAIKDILRESMDYILGLSIALGFGIAAIAPEFVPIYFGDQFLPCIRILCGLAITTPFSGWANVIRTQCIIPLKYDKVYLVAEFAGAGINLFLNLIFIRRFGAIGAVIGTIVAEGVVTIVQTIYVKNEIETFVYFKNGLVYLCIGALMFFVVRWTAARISISIITLLLEIFLGATVYICLWFLYYKVKSKLVR